MTSERVLVPRQCAAVSGLCPDRRDEGGPFKVPGAMARYGYDLGWLFLAAVGLWGMLAWPASAFAGAGGLEGLTYAAILCLLPGVAVVAASVRLRNSSLLVWVILSGTLVRMFLALGGLLAVRHFRPDLDLWYFVAWLLLFYAAMLSVETLIVLRRRNRTASSDSRPD